MKPTLLFVITLTTISLFLSENVLAEITGDENSVAVYMKKTKDLKDALKKATKEAEKHCKKYDKVAKLDRTEKGGKKDKSGVAYYSCVSEDGDSAEATEANESEESSEAAESNE